MYYTCEIVKDFNGLYYCNLFIDGEQIKDMPEYVSFETIIDAIYEKIGVKLENIGFERIGRKFYGYAEGDIEDKEHTIHNDKKTNMKYWDDIENVVEMAIMTVALEYSDKDIDPSKLENNITDIVKETTGVIIKRLENIGGKFPYVDENY